MQHSVHYEQVGEVVFRKLKKSKTIRITLRPGKPVQVTLPYLCPYEEAQKLVVSKSNWILEQQAKLKDMAIPARPSMSPERIEALRTQAKGYLPQRTALLAEQFGFTYQRITIKDIKSRWGSCSHMNNLNYSLYLMLLPPHLIDYVILHELCHTKEKNHGPGFWALMDKVTGSRAKSLAIEVKQVGRGLF